MGNWQKKVKIQNDHDAIDLNWEIVVSNPEPWWHFTPESPLNGTLGPNAESQDVWIEVDRTGKANGEYYGDFLVRATGINYEFSQPVRFMMEVTTDLNLVGQLGNFVWYDLNEDGIQDEDEPGAYYVKVTLNNGAEARTNTSGVYMFHDIDAGDYTAHFTRLPAGYKFTAQHQGLDESRDSDVDADGFSGVVTVPAWSTYRSLDAGIVPIGVQNSYVGDWVWNDFNENGIQDTNEPGLSDVAVRLFQSDEPETLYRETRSDSIGQYGFSDIESGDYFIQYISPEGYVFSPIDAGEDDQIDSDLDINGKTAVFTLTTGEVDSSLDAGFYQKSVPDFDASQLTGHTGVAIQFTNKTRNNGRVNYWDFGDGYQAEYQTDYQNHFHPRHKYTEPGEFDVTLCVETPEGLDSLQLPGMISIDDTADYLALELAELASESESIWQNLIDGDIYGADSYVDVSLDNNAAIFICPDSSVYEIHKIRVLSQTVNSMVPDACLVDDFRVLASLNGNTFFPVFSGHCQVQNGHWQNFEMEHSVVARYLKIVFTTNRGGTEDRFSMAEMQFFGTTRSDILSPEKENSFVETIPRQFSVSENYPNPFNPETRIEYSLPETATITLEIFNIRGQCLATPVNAVEHSVGQYRIMWNAPETMGPRVSGGVYFYRLRAEMSSGKSHFITRKMTYLP